MSLGNQIEVGCYYFPNYHVDPRNELVHGPKWTEWQLVRYATPRFPGHAQPKIPLWGYEDESDPQVMEKKIAAAANHGVDYFIFDWYYYDDGPFLDRCLEQGFLKASNVHRLKFCCMWANHDWINVHPIGRRSNWDLLYPGRVTLETFERITRLLIERYFSHPSHFQVDGCPYFSIYDIGKFAENFGSLKATREAVDRFREEVRKAGFPNLHLNAVAWGQPVLPGEKAVSNLHDVISEIGFDSITSSVWIHHVAPDRVPLASYVYMFEKYLRHWEEVLQQYSIPYFPNVSMGWDNSPRTIQSETWEPIPNSMFSHMQEGNTPEAFQRVLEETRKRLVRLKGPRIMNINSWNEWTEGSYIEPDTVTGVGYLEAIANVFGRAKS